MFELKKIANGLREKKREIEKKKKSVIIDITIC